MRSGLAGRERRQAQDVRTDHSPNWTDGRTIRHAVARHRGVPMCCSSQWDRINDCNFGGYLDFVGIPPFIDGRAEPYGQTYILRHVGALSLRNLPDFLRLLEEYRIGATLFALSTPAVALLDRLPDWKRVYAHDIAVVHMVR
jgi:hypothetical protein